MADSYRRPVKAIIDKLACPDCRNSLLELKSSQGLQCSHCGQVYPVVDGLPFLLPADALHEHVQQDYDRRISGNIVNRGKAGGEYHWKKYHIEEFLPHSARAREALLLGCGDAKERPFLHNLGYETVAFDLTRSLGTDFLADAHSLPIQDATFDVVLSMQVLEHLHSPWLAAAHIARVLRPGGWFVGSVAFLKPFHRSYFHMTHLGVTHLLESQGLKIDKLAGAQSVAYSIYGSLLPLGSPSISRAVYGTLDWMIGTARASFWALSRRKGADQPTDHYGAGIPLSFRTFDKLRVAPAIVFRAQKVID